jgi:hypothetical protein
LRTIRFAAEAELELARVRDVKVALIERAAAFGRFDVPKRFASPKDRGGLDHVALLAERRLSARATGGWLMAFVAA